MSKRAIQKLHQLLEVERAALLAGDLDAIKGLAADKEALVQQFGDSNSRDLSKLSGALARNGALLSAAQDGVALVLTTLREQREARESLSGYDSTGKATTISQRAHGTERRF
jgi:flagellar biosynthesis/type III secretory pathway chaperone